MLQKFDKVLHAADKILVFNEDFNKVTFIANQRHILAVDLDKINLDNDKKFDEDDPDTVIHVRPLAWHSKFEKCKALKKDECRVNAISVVSQKIVEFFHVRRREKRNRTNFY